MFSQNGFSLLGVGVGVIMSCSSCSKRGSNYVYSGDGKWGDAEERRNREGDGTRKVMEEQGR
jgi:hypothetical protein